MTYRATGVVALVLLVGASTTARATEPCQRACQCAHYYARPVWAPSNVGLPTNPRLFIANPHGEILPQVTLTLDGDEASVPVRLEAAGGTDHLFVIPEEELAPGALYHFSFRWEHVAGGGHSTSFMTLAERDDAPPTLDASIAPPLDPSSEAAPCEPLVGTRVDVVPEDESAFQTLIQTTVRMEGEDDVVLFHTASMYRVNRIVIGAGDQSICALDIPSWIDSLPFAVDGAAVEIEVVAYDLAGNASAPVTLTPTLEPTAVATDTTHRGACCSVSRVGAGARLGWLPAAAFALALLGRRRRRG